MRSIKYEMIVQAVAEMCEAANHELPRDVLAALEKARIAETNERAQKILSLLLENAVISQKERIPLCQDTGVAVIFVELGSNVSITAPAENPSATLTDAINEGVAKGYDFGYLRKSIVAEPLSKRPNTNTNTPAIIHYEIAAGDLLKISVMPKGGGCENKSQFKMFKPTADSGQIINWVIDVVRQAGADACPPFVVGVGLGGNFEKACLLSKKALLRPLGSKHTDCCYAQLETAMLAGINKTGIGPQGLGGDTTALGLMIETAPCHIASLPVAVNIECHAHRHKSIIL